MRNILGAIALTIVALTTTACGTNAEASSAPHGMTGGVVTHHEFCRVKPGMTPAEVRAIYGVAPDKRTGYWSGRALKFHLGVAYRTARGGWTSVTFVDRHDTGHVRLVRKEWDNRDC